MSGASAPARQARHECRVRRRVGCGPCDGARPRFPDRHACASADENRAPCGVADCSADTCVCSWDRGSPVRNEPVTTRSWAASNRMKESLFVDKSLWLSVKICRAVSADRPTNGTRVPVRRSNRRLRSRSALLAHLQRRVSSRHAVGGRILAAACGQSLAAPGGLLLASDERPTFFPAVPHGCLGAPSGTHSLWKIVWTGSTNGGHQVEIERIVRYGSGDGPYPRME
jgi:hypothetical protein